MIVEVIYNDLPINNLLAISAPNEYQAPDRQDIIPEFDGRERE